jgi:putative membrane protein
MLAVFAVVLVWSGVEPKDRFTWVLEVAPAVMGVALLALIHRRYSLSDLTCLFILVQAVILMAGGRYTYAENPLFDWLKVQLELSRNYYDRLGHFFQGFTPALITREVLIRNGALRRPGWLPFFALATALAISACYEFVEWWVALATGEAAEAFLGTQGDVWDTQWDMFMALVGAAVAMLFFSGAQDRSLAVSGWPAPPPWPGPAPREGRA